MLFKKYSTITQEKVFSDTFSTTALAVYEKFESAEALAVYQRQYSPNVLVSVPGIGPTYSARIMAEIVDIHHFKNQATLAKYASLAWQ